MLRVIDGPSLLLLPLPFKSGHRGLDKYKSRDGLATKVCFLTPKGLCNNVQALMVVSDPVGKRGDISLVQLLRQGMAEPECSEHCVLPGTESNRVAAQAHPI